MKPTPLTRLGKLAAKDKAFFKLLRDDPEAGLKQAAKSGITLSPKETKILTRAMSGRPVVVTFDFSDWVKSMHAATPRLKAKPGDWPLWGGHIWKWKVVTNLEPAAKRASARRGARAGYRARRPKSGKR
jgi:hypothetical protein